MTESLWIVDAIARETLLFASVGLLIGGLDDVVVDIISSCCVFARDTGLA